MEIFLLLNISIRDGLHFLGDFVFWALIVSDQHLISHDQSEFQIKKIHQQCVHNITPKTKATSKVLYSMTN
jgi:hypothetical protein